MNYLGAKILVERKLDYSDEFLWHLVMFPQCPEHLIVDARSHAFTNDIDMIKMSASEIIQGVKY